MSQGKETIVLVLSMLITAGVAGGGYLYFSQQGKQVQSPSTPQSTTPVNLSNPPNNPVSVTSLNFETTLPNPSILSMDGSTTMVALVKDLRNAYSQINPNTPTIYGVPDGSPTGSSQGLKNLINGSVAIAATSRPLKSEEAEAGIQLVPIAKDAIAIVIGINNPFKGGLTKDQVRDIYQGKITNW